MIKRTMDELGRMSVEEYRAADKLPMVVVLDNVRSQHNVGAVFRTADAMRIAGVVLCGICCCPPNQEIHKTALGAENSVEWSYFRNTADAVMQLREQGFRVFAVEQAHDSVTLEAFCEQFTNHQSPGASSRQTGGAASAEKGLNNHQSPIAVIFGHEVFGVRQEVIDLCDGCIEIPQYGTKHSLNVSVTAGIVIYRISEALRH